MDDNERKTLNRGRKLITFFYTGQTQLLSSKSKQNGRHPKSSYFNQKRGERKNKWIPGAEVATDKWMGGAFLLEIKFLLRNKQSVMNTPSFLLVEEEHESFIEWFVKFHESTNL